MIEEKLEKVRKSYIGQAVPSYLINDGWRDLYTKLDLQKGLNFRLIFGRALIFASVALVFLGSVVGAAQAAKPGNALYPVKLLSDDIVAKVAGKPEIKIERRGQDIIDLSNNSKEQINEATNEYQKSLDETKKEVEKSGKSENVENALDQQEQKFREAQRRNPQSARNFDDAIRKTKEVKKQVQRNQGRDGENGGGGRENRNHNDSGHDSGNHGSD